jgi:ribonuclease HII
MSKDKARYLIGVDEVGRGPLAGPVCVGLVAIEKKSAKKILSKFSALRDSKKMNENNREEIYKSVLKNKHNVEIFFEIQKCSAKEIDKIGISKCIKKCIKSGLKNLEKKGIHGGNTEVRLDGALRAPSTYPNQKTIIRGDDSEKIISLASVLAKVYRDNLMTKLHKKFPEYNFAQNKGYGTKAHILAIKKHGQTFEHRKSFCTRF